MADDVAAVSEIRINSILNTILQSGAFGKSLFKFPADVQLMIDDTDYGVGNADGFETMDMEDYIRSLWSLPCMKGVSEDEAETMAEKRIFHIPSVKDTSVGVYECVFRMRVKYGIRKFILVASGVDERENLYDSLRLLREHYSMLFGDIPVNITLFDSEDRALIRNYAVSDAIEILLINSQFFIRSNNIVNKVKDDDGSRPIDNIASSRPVVMCTADDIKKLKNLYGSASAFNPLFTLCMTQSDSTAEGIISFASEDAETDETDNIRDAEADSSQLTFG